MTAPAEGVVEPAAAQPASTTPDVPGAAGVELDREITVVGVVWTPEHASECPIGAALAVEYATRAGDFL